MATHSTTLEQRLRKDDLPAPDHGERVIWDHQVKGLGLRLRTKWRPVWIVQRRIDRRSIKQTIGPLADLDIEEARAAALALFAPQAPKPAPRLAAFVHTFLRDCAGRWKPATQRSHRYDLDKQVVPVLGAKRIDKLTRADVVVWFEENTQSDGNRNRALSVLSSMMRHAEVHGLRPQGSNPCAGLRRRRPDFKARYLSDPEFRRLGWALEQLERSNPVEVALIRFLMLTGARKGEALTLQWSVIQGARAVLSDSKTGPKTIWLALPVRRLLAGLVRSEHSPRVFAIPDDRSMRYALNRVWHQARHLAGLQSLRLHDLRHNYASIAVTTGEQLRTVAGLLGHAEVATTMGYAHLAQGPIKAAAGRVSNHLAAAITPAEPLKPIKSGPRKPPTRCRRSQRAAGAQQDNGAIDPGLTEFERYWEPHVLAFRSGRLKLPEFCKQHGLDPTRLRIAVRKHFARQKARVGRPA